MTDFVASTILVLANASGDLFVVDYLYGGEYKYRIQLRKTTDPVSVAEIDELDYHYLNIVGDNLRCIIEGFWEEGFTIINRDEGDLTDYIPVEEEDDKCGKCGKYDCYNGNEVCEYCYAEALGTDVYTCDDCGEKTYTFGKFENTENGLFCGACIPE
jgi:hypothetical protein